MDRQEKHIYSVSELAKYIKAILEESFPSVWVEGEISNFIHHSSGHMYFTLKDPGSAIKCAMFKGSNMRLRFKPRDGMKALCLGSVSLYVPRGDYQLIVNDMEPRGIGALELAFQQLKEKLAKEGLFDESRKKPIPHLPTRIGVVTSPTGAAIQDILNVLRRRFANVEVIINPVKVQGKGAKEEIAAAIRQFNELKNIDVMIVARGGGSLEDLWPFNEEEVARAIYGSEIPVISAVGHEIDFTIADFAADFRAPTPSAAAELVIPRKEDLANLVEAQAARLKNALSNMMASFTERLALLKDSYIMRRPLDLVQQYEQLIDDLRGDVSVRMGHLLDMDGENLKLYTHKLEALNPLSILNRGYSVTTKLPEGVIIKEASALSKGDLVRTRLGRGSFVGRVEEVGQ